MHIKHNTYGKLYVFQYLTQTRPTSCQLCPDTGIIHVFHIVTNYYYINSNALDWNLISKKKPTIQGFLQDSAILCNEEVTASVIQG